MHAHSTMINLPSESEFTRSASQCLDRILTHVLRHRVSIVSVHIFCVTVSLYPYTYSASPSLCILTHVLRHRLSVTVLTHVLRHRVSIVSVHIFCITVCPYPYIIIVFCVTASPYPYTCSALPSLRILTHILRHRLSVSYTCSASPSLRILTYVLGHRLSVSFHMFCVTGSRSYPYIIIVFCVTVSPYPYTCSA